MSSNAEHDADLIERDIRHTQDEIGATVQKLEEQLAPRQMVRSVIGDEQVDLIGEAIELAKRNPIPVALIAVGAIWLLARSGAQGVDLLERVSGRRAAAAHAAPAEAVAAESARPSRVEIHRHERGDGPSGDASLPIDQRPILA